MFTRNFMKTFPVRKYARLSGATGSISTDIAIMGPRDILPYRLGVFFFVSLVTVTAYSNFQFFYQTVRHVPGPKHFASWQSSVPQSVKGPNQQIIQNYIKIQEVKDWVKTMQPLQ